MTATGAALAPLVDALLAEPLDELDVAQLQAAITTVTPLVARLHGWLTAAAGSSTSSPAAPSPIRTAGPAPPPAGSPTSSTAPPARPAGSCGPPGLLRTLPLVTAAVLDGTLTPQQAPCSPGSSAGSTSRRWSSRSRS
jgi:hypothetical protein